MAIEIPGFKLSGIAATDLTQYTFVSATTGASAPTVSTATSGANRVLGVVQNAPTTGAVAEIMVSGVSKVYAAGAIKAGAAVTSDNSGKASAAVVGVGTASLGVALSTAAADQLVTVLLGTNKS
jgi:hypothetical protein